MVTLPTYRIKGLPVPQTAEKPPSFVLRKEMRLSPLSFTNGPFRPVVWSLASPWKNNSPGPEQVLILNDVEPSERYR